MNLKQYLEEKKVWYRIHDKDTTVHTSDAAAKTGIPLEKITKSLVCLDDDKAVIGIIRGNDKLSNKKLAKIIGVKKVRICPFEEAHKYSGYDPGATPPCNYRKIERVVVDENVMKYNTVFGGGGTRKKLLEIKPQDIVKLNNATVSDISNEI
ncbi:MAG: aminoacyl-tRNA deacylase [Asgard group archaeon]|nr:aminoacyl-tRNA deacylase [Asgard group archaeon]